MVDHGALGEEGEGVKQLEDGVARLVDGHDDDALTLLAQTAQSAKMGQINAHSLRTKVSDTHNLIDFRLP